MMPRAIFGKVIRWLSGLRHNGEYKAFLVASEIFDSRTDDLIRCANRQRTLPK